MGAAMRNHGVTQTIFAEQPAKTPTKTAEKSGRFVMLCSSLQSPNFLEIRIPIAPRITVKYIKTCKKNAKQTENQEKE